MDDKMFELNIFEESVESRKERKKKFKLNYFKTHKTIDMRGPLSDLPFGPFGATAFGMQLMKKSPKPKKHPGIPILGTTLFVVEKNGEYVVENARETTEHSEDEEDLYNIFLESLSTNEAEEIINEFAEDHDMKIKIFTNDTKMYEMMKLRNVAFHTIELNNRNREQLDLYGDLNNYYFTGNCNKYLVAVAPDLIHENLMDEAPLKRMLLHEYGHTKTMHRITINEWLEYFMKINVLQTIPSLESVLNIAKFNELEMERKCVYYNLYPERIANQYSNVDFRLLIKDLDGEYPLPGWKNNRLFTLVDAYVHRDVFPVLKKVFIDIVELTDDEYTEYALVLEDIYERCFDKNVAAILTNALYEI